MFCISRRTYGSYITLVHKSVFCNYIFIFYLYLLIQGRGGEGKEEEEEEEEEEEDYNKVIFNS